MRSGPSRWSRLLSVTLSLIVPVLALADAPVPEATPAASAPTRLNIQSPSLGAEVGDLDASFLLSLDIPTFQLDPGPRFSLELMYGTADLAPHLRLALGGRTSFAFHSFAGGNQWVLEFVPDAKVRYAITDQLAAYGDLGLGLALLHTSLDLGASSMPAAFTIQVGGGIAVALSSELNFLAEIRFNMYTKTGEATLIAFPTIGLEYH